MYEQAKTSIVRIYKRQDLKYWPIGCGFFIGGRSILTCRHVVRYALPPERNLSRKEVELDFPFLPSSGTLIKAKVILEVEQPDLAVLELLSDPPDTAIPMPLSTEMNLWDHPYITFGITKERPEGFINNGRIKGRVGDGTIQMESESAFSVEKGFSGTAVWDDKIKKAVGMVVTTESDQETKAAYAIPVADILEKCPELMSLVAGNQPSTRPNAFSSQKRLTESDTLPAGSRLPFSPNDVFTGRREDLLELASVLQYAQDGRESTNQGIVVTGMGGLGKTQLAVEFCYRCGRFFQGVHWLQANQNLQAEIAENGLAMNLSYWPDKLSEQVQVTLKTWQENSQRLIVIDNAEDLSVVQDWMPRLRPARLLITSQRENWPKGLGLKVKSLEVLARNDSIELLRKLALRLKESDDQLDSLANYLEDLPLALDLAGRYMADRSELSIEDYLAELKKTGSALEHASFKDWTEYSPTKHSTCLVATFNLSWQRLDESDDLAKRLFRMAGYCAPNKSIPRQLLAKTMRADMPDHELDRSLRKLNSLGLIKYADGGWKMHGLLAEFARWQDRHAEESVLSDLARGIVELAQAIHTTNGFDRAKRMMTLWNHLIPVYRFAKTAGLEESELLSDFLPRLDFSRPENSMYSCLL